MKYIDCKKDSDWLTQVLNALNCQGFCIVHHVLDEQFVSDVRPAMYIAQELIHAEVGQARLQAAGELGVLRLMLKFDPIFYKLLEIPEILSIIDNTVSPTAILHLQNGFILPSFPPTSTPEVFQNKLHRDFPRVLNGYLTSINTLLAIDEFTAANGGTLLVPGSHQKMTAPDLNYMRAHAIPAECPPGSMLVFDSTLWHAAGQNVSGKDRLGINQQFTRSYIKQQLDYVRALGEPVIKVQKERTQQLLGYYTRVVTSLDEYYRPESERLYRRGQG